MTFVPNQPLQNGKYTIAQEFGRRRFGMTDLARDRDDNRWVIKTLNDSLLATLTAEERDRLQSLLWQEAGKLRSC